MTRRFHIPSQAVVKAHQGIEADLVRVRKKSGADVESIDHREHQRAVGQAIEMAVMPPGAVEMVHLRPGLAIILGDGDGQPFDVIVERTRKKVLWEHVGAQGGHQVAVGRPDDGSLAHATGVRRSPEFRVKLPLRRRHFILPVHPAVGRRADKARRVAAGPNAVAWLVMKAN